MANDVLWFDCGWSKLPVLQEKFDLIISNPPYITKHDLNHLQSDVKDYEPHLALDGGVDGLDSYREIAPIIAKNLKDNGKAVLEIGVFQDYDVVKIMEGEGLQLIEELNDLSGRVRALVLRPQLSS